MKVYFRIKMVFFLVAVPFLVAPPSASPGTAGNNSATPADTVAGHPSAAGLVSGVTAVFRQLNYALAGSVAMFRVIKEKGIKTDVNKLDAALSEVEERFGFTVSRNNGGVRAP